MVIAQKLIARTVAFALLLVLCLAALLLLLALQREAMVPAATSLTAADIARVEQLLVDSAPGDMSHTELRKLSLSNVELNLLLRYASELAGMDSGINSQVYLPGHKLVTDVSVPVSSLLRPLYLNLSAEFLSTGERLRLDSLKVGRLRIPGSLVNNLASQVENRYLADQEAYSDILELLDSVTRIDLETDRLNLDFMWAPDLLKKIQVQAQKFLISEPDQLRIARYQKLLSEVIQDIPETTRAIPLNALLKPLFAAAMNESQREMAPDPVAENRALLLTVAAYVNGEPIDQLLHNDMDEQLVTPRLIEVRIQRRQDLAQHVMFSAAIAASAGMGVAQILSNVKENYDARYRTGFSFSDVTANTAGMAIGTLATQSEEMALEIQRRMASLSGDADYLPQVASNRDGLTETDFSSRYRDENSDKYQERLQEIETLVYQQPLFLGLVTR